MQLYIFTMGISFLLFSCKEIKKEIPDININEEKTPITKKSDSLKSVDTILNAASIVSNNKNNFLRFFRINEFPKWASKCNYISVKEPNEEQDELYAIISDEQHTAKNPEVPYVEFLSFIDNNKIVYLQFKNQTTSSSGFPVWHYESETIIVTIEILSIDKGNSTGVFKYYKEGSLLKTIEMDTGNIY